MDVFYIGKQVDDSDQPIFAFAVDTGVDGLAR